VKGDGKPRRVRRNLERDLDISVVLSARHRSVQSQVGFLGKRRYSDQQDED